MTVLDWLLDSDPSIRWQVRRDLLGESELVVSRERSRVAVEDGRVLAAGAYFGQASDRLVDRLLQEQLRDGGWNCDAPRSRRSSFHTTI